MRRIRLVIADRRPVVLQGFASLLAEERDFEVVASCLDGISCLEAVRNLTPDVALVEDGFSDVTASEMIAAADNENLSARLVFYTASVAHGDLAAAVANGACNAVSMREKPETLLQRLRLLAPPPGRAAAGRQDNGACGEHGPTLLTDQERKIMRLVASGMSNAEIARQLRVSTGTIKAHVDRIFAQFEIRNRKQLATFTLSRLGGIGALAALIYAALDDFHAANATNADHAHTDTFTVRPADGTGTVLTVKVSPQKAAAASTKTDKAGRIASSLVDTPMRASKPVDVSADIAASAMTLPTLASPRPGLSSAFMLTTVGVWLYELFNNVAHASNARDGVSDIFASAATHGTSELVAHRTPGSTDAKLNGFDKLASLNPDIRHDSSFEKSRSDDIGKNSDGHQITDGAAGEDGISGNGSGPHVGSGAIASIDHGSVNQAVTSDESRSEHDTRQAIAGDGSTGGQSQHDAHASEDGVAADEPHVGDDPPGHDPDHGQSQGALHASENSAAADKPNAKETPPGHDPDHGQSQGALHASENSAAADKSNAKETPPGHDPDHGQSQGALHASENSAAAGKPDVKDTPPGHDPDHGQSQGALHASENSAAADKSNAKETPPGHDTDHGQSQADLHEAHSNASGNPHAVTSQSTGGNDQAADDAGQTLSAAAAQPADSFHFKNDVAAAKASDTAEGHGSHGQDTVDNNPHSAAIDVPAPIPDADPTGSSHADQNAIDHAKDVAHHSAHDLIV